MANEITPNQRLEELRRRVAEERPADKVKITAEAEKLQNAMAALGNITNDLSFEKVYDTLRSNDGGAKADALYTKWMEEKTRKQLEDEKKTPEDRMEELLRLPVREDYMNRRVYGEDERFAVVREVMATRSLSREYREHPERFQTVGQVDDRYKKIWASFGSFTDALNYIQENQMDLISEDPSGGKLEAAFKKAISCCRTGAMCSWPPVSSPKPAKPRRSNP